MPKMDGLEATEKIRTDIPLAEQPIIIALTANAFPENRRRCYLAGMNNVLTKPLQKKELIEALNQYSLKR
jgi:CheY-like chemotaxis protein